jgi:hypothetical protein
MRDARNPQPRCWLCVLVFKRPPADSPLACIYLPFAALYSRTHPLFNRHPSAMHLALYGSTPPFNRLLPSAAMLLPYSPPPLA